MAGESARAAQISQETPDCARIAARGDFIQCLFHGEMIAWPCAQLAPEQIIGPALQPIDDEDRLQLLATFRECQGLEPGSRETADEAAAMLLEIGARNSREGGPPGQ